MIYILRWSELKRTEGGMGVQTAIDELKRNGIKARNCYTMYVGHVGMEVITKTKDEVKKAIQVMANVGYDEFNEDDFVSEIEN